MVGSAVDLCAWNEVRVAADEMVQDRVGADDQEHASRGRKRRASRVARRTRGS